MSILTSARHRTEREHRRMISREKWLKRREERRAARTQARLERSVRRDERKEKRRTPRERRALAKAALGLYQLQKSEAFRPKRDVEPLASKLWWRITWTNSVAGFFDGLNVTLFTILGGIILGFTCAGRLDFYPQWLITFLDGIQPQALAYPFVLWPFAVCFAVFYLCYRLSRHLNLQARAEFYVLKLRFHDLCGARDVVFKVDKKLYDDIVLGTAMRPDLGCYQVPDGESVWEIEARKALAAIVKHPKAS